MLERLDYLKRAKLIAKELRITDNQIDNLFILNPMYP